MPMQRNLYPRNWPQLAARLKKAAHWRCQECGARRGELAPNRHGTLVPVVVTVAHLDHDPWNAHARLAVLCARCHIRYDAHDARRKRVMMAIARGQLVLPGMAAWYPQPDRRRRKARVRHVARVRT